MRGAAIVGGAVGVAMVAVSLWYAFSTGAGGLNAVLRTHQLEAPLTFARATLFGAVKDSVTPLPDAMAKRELQLRRADQDTFAVAISENGEALMTVTLTLKEAPKGGGTIMTYRLTHNELALGEMLMADQEGSDEPARFSPAGVSDQMERLSGQLAYAAGRAYQGVSDTRRETMVRNPNWGQAAILYVEAMRNLAPGALRADARPQ
jgi:hypothetical protein